MLLGPMLKSDNIFFFYFNKSYQVWLPLCTGRLFHLILVFLLKPGIYFLYWDYSFLQCINLIKLNL